jgi:hypothetical protein
MTGPRLWLGAGTSLGAAAVAVVALGVVPTNLLARAVGAPWPVANPATDVVAAAFIGLSVAAGLAIPALTSRVTARLPQPSGMLRRVVIFSQERGIGRLADPYAVVGGAVIATGRLSAAILDNTLGRLVRAG